VGTAAVLAFLALLALGASHRPAQADPAAPVATPEPGIQAPPGYRDHDRDGFGPRDGFGGPGPDDGGGMIPAPPGDGGGGGTAPAPSTGGSQT
jgi:hypothetical protein